MKHNIGYAIIFVLFIIGMMFIFPGCSNTKLTSQWTIEGLGTKSIEYTGRFTEKQIRREFEECDTSPECIWITREEME